jgi:hypothetical protein
MSWLDRGPPLARYPEEEEQPRRALERRGAPVPRAFPRMVIVGAPPDMVKWGLPGATGETLAYVDRVDRLADKLHTAFIAWIREKFGDGAETEVPPTEDERQFIVDWQPWYSRWKVFVESIQPQWNPFGPLPLEVWEKTQQWELELKGFRSRFAALTQGTKVKAPDDPGNLEPAGGVDPDKAGAGASKTGIPWTPILVIGGVLAAGYALSSVGHLTGRY